MSAVCYCDHCQQGGQLIEALPNSQPVLDDDGGTQYLSYRDDRFTCITGAELLTGYKLGERSPSQRMVASCCNTGMFLKFGPGHWVSAYRLRFEGDVPTVEMRNQTKYRTSAKPIPEDAPSYSGYPPKLIFRLLGSRLAMLIGR